MRTNKAALLTTFATAASVSAGIGAVDAIQSQEVSEKISIVGTVDGGESYPVTSELPVDNKDGARSVLIRTEDGEEWPIEVKSDGEVMMKTEDGGEFPILP